MIYRIVVYDRFDDNTYSYLSDEKLEVDDEYALITSSVANIETTTIQELLQAISSEMEDNNYHRLNGVMDVVVDYLYKSAISDDEIKNFLWQFCWEKGFLLGL